MIPTSGDCVPVADQTPCGSGQVCCSGTCQDSCSGNCPTGQYTCGVTQPYNNDNNTRPDSVCCDNGTSCCGGNGYFYEICGGSTYNDQHICCEPGHQPVRRELLRPRDAVVPGRRHLLATTAVQQDPMECFRTAPAAAQGRGRSDASAMRCMSDTVHVAQLAREERYRTARAARQVPMSTCAAQIHQQIH